MSKPPQARKGSQLKIKERLLPFSFWPTYQGATRVGLQSTVFALDPWTIINTSVKQHCPDNAKAEALAYVEQAKDFYHAAMSSAVAAARPLLLYYCFMNLAKALVVHRGTRRTITSAAHGLKERLRGATPPYPRFAATDFLDPQALATKLNASSRPIDAWVKNQLSGHTVALFLQPRLTKQELLALQQNLVSDFDAIIKQGASIFDTARFAGEHLSAEAKKSFTQNLQGVDLERHNRLLLECIYPGELSAHQGRELEDAFLKAEQSTAGKAQVFDEFLKAIAQAGLVAEHDFPLAKLLPQILPGHRLWAEAANQDERFVSIYEIRVMENKAAKKIWLNLYFFNDDLKRLGITHKRLLSESRLGGGFQQVRTTRKIGKRSLVCFEQCSTVSYQQRPSDEAYQLVAAIRPYLWVTVATIPPYRRYYAYLAPSAEHSELLPQLLSIYSVTFYLGSITRYRPHHFDKIVDGPFGPRVEEFISGQTLQFIYMMASEFAQQEVTRPSIV